MSKKKTIFNMKIRDDAVVLDFHSFPLKSRLTTMICILLGGELTIYAKIKLHIKQRNV